MSKTVQKALSVLLSAVLLFSVLSLVQVSALDSNAGVVELTGYAYEAVKSNRVKDATATIYFKQGGSAVQWNAGVYGQNNPIITDSFGAFHWDVDEGDWQIRVGKSGYEPAESTWMSVPPRWTNIEIPMVCREAPEVADVMKDGERYLLTFSRYMDLTTITSANIKLANSDHNVSYSLTPLDKEVSGTSSSVYYAKKFALVPTDTVTSITVKNVKSYAGTMIASEYMKLFETSLGYTVTYHANGGLSAPEPQTKVDGQTLVLRTEEPTHSNPAYVFMGWNTKADGTGISYGPGSNYFANKDLDLYAMWQNGDRIVRSIKASNVSVNFRSSTAIPSTVVADVGCRYGLSYQVKDSSIASVDGSGVVKGLKRGSTQVVVTATDSFGNRVSATSTVTVRYTIPQWIIVYLLFGWKWYL